MNHRQLYLLTTLLVISFALPAAAEEDASPGAWSKTKDAFNEFYPKYIPGHLEIGTRATHYTFTDDTQGEPHQGSFLGSLNEVHESQNYAPVKVFLQYNIRKTDDMIQGRSKFVTHVGQKITFNAVCRFCLLC